MPGGRLLGAFGVLLSYLIAHTVQMKSEYQLYAARPYGSIAGLARDGIGTKAEANA